MSHDSEQCGLTLNVLCLSLSQLMDAFQLLFLVAVVTSISEWKSGGVYCTWFSCMCGLTLQWNHGEAVVSLQVLIRLIQPLMWNTYHDNFEQAVGKVKSNVIIDGLAKHQSQDAEGKNVWQDRKAKKSLKTLRRKRKGAFHKLFHVMVWHCSICNTPFTFAFALIITSICFSLSFRFLQFTM